MHFLEDERKLNATSVINLPCHKIEVFGDIQNVTPLVVQVKEYMLGSVFLMHVSSDCSKYAVHTIETLQPFVFENRSPSNKELQEITQRHINRFNS